MKKQHILLCGITAFFGASAIDSSLDCSSSIQEKMVQSAEINRFIAKLIPGHTIDTTSLPEPRKKRLIQFIEGAITLDNQVHEMQKKIATMPTSAADRQELKETKKLYFREKRAIRELLLSISDRPITKTKEELQAQASHDIKNAYETISSLTHTKPSKKEQRDNKPAARSLFSSRSTKNCARNVEIAFSAITLASIDVISECHNSIQQLTHSYKEPLQCQDIDLEMAMLRSQWFDNVSPDDVGQPIADTSPALISIDNKPVLTEKKFNKTYELLVAENLKLSAAKEWLKKLPYAKRQEPAIDSSPDMNIIDDYDLCTLRNPEFDCLSSEMPDCDVLSALLDDIEE